MLFGLALAVLFKERHLGRINLVIPMSAIRASDQAQLRRLRSGLISRLFVQVNGMMCQTSKHIKSLTKMLASGCVSIWLSIVRCLHILCHAAQTMVGIQVTGCGRVTLACEWMDCQCSNRSRTCRQTKFRRGRRSTVLRHMLKIPVKLSRQSHHVLR